jgi:hypothetical protein
VVIVVVVHQRSPTPVIGHADLIGGQADLFPRVHRAR